MGFIGHLFGMFRWSWFQNGQVEKYLISGLIESVKSGSVMVENDESDDTRIRLISKDIIFIVERHGPDSCLYADGPTSESLISRGTLLKDLFSASMARLDKDKERQAAVVRLEREFNGWYSKKTSR